MLLFNSCIFGSCAGAVWMRVSVRLLLLDDVPRSDGVPGRRRDGVPGRLGASLATRCTTIRALGCAESRFASPLWCSKATSEMTNSACACKCHHPQ
eukprot:scaffold28986_cov58-Phaeocystis_antarctica.AAC.3